MRSLWLCLLIAGCGDPIPEEPEPHYLLEIRNIRTASTCACATERTLHVEPGCTFTLEGDAVDEVGAPFTGRLFVDTSLFDRSSPRMDEVVTTLGAFSWTHEYEAYGTDEATTLVISDHFGYPTFLSGRDVPPRDGVYLACAYWTDLRDVVLPQSSVGLFGPSCMGDISVGTELILHAQLRGSVDAHVSAVVMEDDPANDDVIESIELEAEAGHLRAHWRSRFPEPREGPGTAEVYFQLELRDDPESEEPDQVLRSENICVNP